MVIARAALIAFLLAPAVWAAPPARTGKTPAPPPAAPAPAPKAAVVVQEAPRQDSLPRFELALKAGGHFPEVWNKLGPSYDLALKAGWAPLEDRRLQTFFELGYSNPTKTSSGSDPRLGADYTTKLSVQDLSTRVGAQWSFIGNLPVTPYAGAALRLDFVKSVVTGSAGAPFDEYRETGTQFGGMVFGGAAFRLWRGELLGELAFSYTPIRQRVTDKANIASTSVMLGYGFWL